MKHFVTTSLRLAGLVCLGIALLYSPSAAYAQRNRKKNDDKSAEVKTPPPYTGIKRRIAVTAISDRNLASLDEDQVAPPANFADVLTDVLTKGLVQSGHFNVFERSKFDAIKSELVLDNSGMVTPDSAVKIGKLEGVEYLITGGITHYANTKGKGGFSVGGISVGNKGGSAELGVDLRVIDAATGAIPFAVHGEGKSDSAGAGVDYVGSALSLSGEKSKSSPLTAAMRNAVDDAVQKLCDQFEHIQAPTWQGKVVDVDLVGGKPSTLYISGGDLSSLKEGDLLDISVPGKEIKSDSGEVLGHKPSRHIATCRVTGKQEKLVTATLTDPGDFQKEDTDSYIVQRVSPPTPPAAPPAPAAGSGDKSTSSDSKP